MINTITIVGRMARDPEKRTTPNGLTITELTIATNEKYTDSSGKLVNDVQFHHITTFNKLAENCATYLKKGQLVGVTGRLTYRTWEDARFVNDAKEAVRRIQARILAREVKFGPKAQPKSDVPDTQAEELDELASVLSTDDGPENDLPF